MLEQLNLCSPNLSKCPLKTLGGGFLGVDSYQMLTIVQESACTNDIPMRARHPWDLLRSFIVQAGEESHSERSVYCGDRLFRDDHFVVEHGQANRCIFARRVIIGFALPYFCNAWQKHRYKNMVEHEMPH